MSINIHHSLIQTQLLPAASSSSSLDFPIMIDCTLKLQNRNKPFLPRVPLVLCIAWDKQYGRSN